MLSTESISDAFKSVQQPDENVYIIGGIINGSLSMLYPEDSIIIVNRSILITENGDVQISKTSFNYSQDRGIRSYGLNLQNVTLKDVEICIEVLESCDVNIDSTTVWNTDHLLIADELIGDLNIYFRNCNITVSNEMLIVGFRKSNSIVIRDDNSIFCSKIGKIFEISELQTQDSITNISFDLFGSDLISYGTYSSYQININSCSGYLHSLIRNSTFDCTYAYSRNIYTQTQATNIEVAQNIFRMSQYAFYFDMTCNRSSKLNTDLERYVNISNNSFKGVSPGSDFYVHESSSYSYKHLFLVYDNVFTYSPSAMNRIGITLELYGVMVQHLFYIKGNYFTSVKNNSVYIYGNVGEVSILENTFHRGTDCIKIGLLNSDYNITISDNVFADNNASTAVLNLLQPNGNVPPILLSGNIFQNNLNTVLLFRSPNIFIFHNTFENPNATFNIKVNSAEQYLFEIVNASLNFWGTTDVKEIGQKIYDKNYDDTLMDVVFRPYLGSRNFSDIQNEESQFISSTGEVGGRVNGDVTLTADRSPYTVTANIEVGEFDTLIVEPDVIVLFNKDVGINVRGTLIVNGSSGMPVMMLETVHGESWRGINIYTAEGLFLYTYCKGKRVLYNALNNIDISYNHYG
ncbi:unnamed protein product [Mytilus edulis]|uniref:Right handed beta helix domain-containing protein n=1 Tax=Mytilus edulis TaxID=6550 RepID=A0A8S3U1P5_MYTED|nr:unnamed protein product [Mytilus edulis]